MVEKVKERSLLGYRCYYVPSLRLNIGSIFIFELTGELSRVDGVPIPTNQEMPDDARMCTEEEMAEVIYEWLMTNPDKGKLWLQEGIQASADPAVRIRYGHREK